MSAHKRVLRGLALSGGGFRATVFHLGVIRYLRETNRLRDLSYVSSVSGGSVSAAHLVLNWDLYTGSEEEFKRAANEIVAFVQSDARGQVFSSWIRGWAYIAWLILLPILATWYWQVGWTTWSVLLLAFCIVWRVCKRRSSMPSWLAIAMPSNDCRRHDHYENHAYHLNQLVEAIELGLRLPKIIVSVPAT